MQVTLDIPDKTITDAINEKVQSFKVVDPFPDVMDKATAARFLHCSRPTLDLWIKGYGLPTVKIGKSFRFIKADMINWLKTHSN